jgi:hypothetical protein
VSFFDGVALSLVEGNVNYLYSPGDGVLVSYDLAKDPREANPREVPGELRQSLIRRLEAFDAYQRQSFAGE